MISAALVHFHAIAAAAYHLLVRYAAYSIFIMQ